jgi:molybdopterin-guanine dinucleotide biosynthesis protein A
MGGVAKGLLPTGSGLSVLDRLLEQSAAALPQASRVLVGNATAYAALALPTIADAPPGVGPLGGLRALLCEAQRSGAEAALALACDLPFLSAPLLRRLGLEAPGSLAVAPRQGALWEPLCARYSVAALPAVDAALAAGERSLQRVFARLGPRALELELDDRERRQLKDWDRPSDLRDPGDE